MSKTKSDNKRRPDHLVSPFALIRISAILTVLLMLGHLWGYPWASTRDPLETQLVDTMHSVDFVFLGERSTYWNLYFGFGVLIAVLLLTLAIVLWLLSDLASVAPQRLGVMIGIISASCLFGAYLSFRFFYIPPFLTFLVICVLLSAAAVQLLRRQTHRDTTGEALS
ncbi:MAG: hypothetical protein E6K53_06140 [Gammaproteobacteria bacterium]|nr:MAG: hypothetical protein E6K53_06140 [Gammaproteobacteria bacterium]